MTGSTETVVFALLVLLGGAVGVFGTLVGVGGGFILTPLLLVMYPRDSAETVTAISLAVVFCNAGSGSVAYGRLRRIDYRSGLAFALATLPGAVVGSLLVAVAPRRMFDILMAVLLGCVSAWLLFAGSRPRRVEPSHLGSPRTVTDSSGNTYRYTVPMQRGVLYSIGVGFVSSFLGIGGGIIHVPILAHALGFPIHLATATSHFVLAITAAVGTITHIASGSFRDGTIDRTVALSMGVVVGAQIGARISQRVHGDVIQRAPNQ